MATYISAFKTFSEITLQNILHSFKDVLKIISRSSSLSGSGDIETNKIKAGDKIDNMRKIVSCHRCDVNISRAPLSTTIRDQNQNKIIKLAYDDKIFD